MKTQLALIACALLCGCAGHTQMLLVNNTSAMLDVTADNGQHFSRLVPGATITVPATHWHCRTVVAVTGYDEDGRYLGANDWTFYNGQAQVWRVDRLTKPQ